MNIFRHDYKKMIGFLSNILATFFYLGYMPLAPGTWGTLGGVVLYLLLAETGIIAYSIVLVLLLISGTVVSGYEEKRLKKKDASQIVIDEAAGFLITMFLVPFHWSLVVWGFVLNRLLDIFKPFPANKAQKLPGGTGVIADDVVSAIYSNILLRLTILLTGFWG